ncbi:cyclase family protein, partial [candidate division WOR-3 bacterium]|nr:cyclase family protein [candidate division WOR-3 bacterium]
MFRKVTLVAVVLFVAIAAYGFGKPALWEFYSAHLVNAKYVDLTHAFMPTQPVWPGFGNAIFEPAKAGKDMGSYASKGDV